MTPVVAALWFHQLPRSRGFIPFDNSVNRPDLQQMVAAAIHSALVAEFGKTGVSNRCNFYAAVGSSVAGHATGVWWRVNKFRLVGSVLRRLDDENPHCFLNVLHDERIRRRCLSLASRLSTRRDSWELSSFAKARRVPAVALESSNLEDAVYRRRHAKERIPRY
jgi:hypothetical protein